MAAMAAFILSAASAVTNGTRANIRSLTRKDPLPMPRFKSFEEHERFLDTFTSTELLADCIDRLTPILTHKKKPSSMRVPVDFEHDDDVFVLDRLRAVKRRISDGKGQKT